MAKKVNWTREALMDAITGSFTYNDILTKFGLSAKGNNVKTLKRYLEKHGVEFVSKPYLKRDYSTITLPNEVVFVENSTTPRSVIRSKILKQNLIEYKCSECETLPTWNGKPLTLQLEHINGVPNDHRLPNLTFLCPNCHSQTDTWAGRGSKKTFDKELKPKVPKMNQTRKPAALAHLTTEELSSMVEKYTFMEIGRMFNVSDTAVRRWCKKLNINLPGQGYRKLVKD